MRPNPAPEDQSPGNGGPQPGRAEDGRCTADVPFGLEPAPAGRDQVVAWFGGDARRSDHRTQVSGSVTLGRGIPRYAPAFAVKDNSREFTRRVHAAGYATDPNYSALVINLVDANRLYRFDVR